MYDEHEESRLRLIRKRGGATANLKKIRFYDDSGLNIVASSTNDEGEVIYYSIINEGIT
jgi:hypothetical protein